MRLWIGSLCLFTLVTSAQAGTFRNAYMSFNLPHNWDCNLDDTEWICTSKDQVASREAIIILTAKEIGAADSLENYRAHLKQAKSIQDNKGQPSFSKVIEVKDKQINNHPWIDGFHLGSEIPNYYTRYLATVKDGLAILITFSAHKAHYTKYAKEFFDGIQSLRVVAPKNLMADKGLNMQSPNESLGTPSANPFALIPDEPMDLPQSKKSNTDTYLGIGLLIVAIGVYFYLKSRPKK